MLRQSPLKEILWFCLSYRGAAVPQPQNTLCESPSEYPGLTCKHPQKSVRGGKKLEGSDFWSFLCRDVVYFRVHMGLLKGARKQGFQNCLFVLCSHLRASINAVYVCEFSQICMAWFCVYLPTFVEAFLHWRRCWNVPLQIEVYLPYCMMNCLYCGVVCYDLAAIPVTLNRNKQVKLMTFCLHFCSFVP